MTTRRSRDPIPVRPRGIMAYVLEMAASEFRHPVLLFVLVVTDDGLLHGRYSLWRGQLTATSA